jgi:hypothetical protein
VSGEIPFSGNRASAPESGLTWQWRETANLARATDKALARRKSVMGGEWLNSEPILIERKKSNA